jgi:hypothetical protein
MLVRGADPPDAYVSEIADLEARLQLALDHERGKTANRSAIRAWEEMIDPKGRLVGAFLATWKTRGKGFSQAELNRRGADVSAAFARLIESSGVEEE